MGAVDERHGGVSGLLPVRSARSSCSATTCAPRCASPRSRSTKVAFVWTHDSVGVGEDGPTHQPIEQLAALRAMPGLRRDPARRRQRGRGRRGACTSTATGPTALILTRQKLPGARRHRRARARRASPRGAYVLVDEDGDDLDLVLIGTGSEVSVVRRARASCSRPTGSSVRVVSMPSWDLFEAQPDDYRVAVLPPGVPTLAVEAGVDLRLGALRRRRRRHRPLRRVGARATVALREFGFTPENVAARAPRAARARGGDA